MSGNRLARSRSKPSQLAQCLDRSDALIFDFLGSIFSLREAVAIIPHGEEYTQKQVGSSLYQRHLNGQKGRLAGLGQHDAGETVTPDETFSEVVRFTQRQLRLRIETLPPGASPDHHEDLREQVLSASLDELAALFGSLSNGWDALIETKMDTQQADQRRRALGAWLFTLVSDCERLIREFSLLGIRAFGADLAPALDDLFESATGPVVPPPSKLLSQSSPTDAIVAATADYAEQGTSQTLAVAETLAGAFDFEVFPDDPTAEHRPTWRAAHGIKPGFVDLLAEVTSHRSPTSRTIWDELVALRERNVHEPVAGSQSATLRRHPLFSSSADQLLLLTDFVAALGLRFGLLVTEAITARSNERLTRKRNAVSEPDIQRRKIAAEVRVITKRLLGEKPPRYALAWTLCELSMISEGGPDKAPMMALNSFYARQELGALNPPSRFIEREEIEALDISNKAPRYELLKRTLLDDYREIDVLLTEIVSRGNMALSEIEEWPALARLRDQAIYVRWRAAQPKAVD